ncbi:hypothetical protein FD755_004353 [Muntiacus reevesi]|uniref:Uncharacterized protein n=1 Tax=Muntiacus reevesi TaxID=9886 RepID=A0A5J5MSW3_MUNRE|nr:hypothetical protein FD755_004353 [Muntiacus reevesi]
MEHTHAHLAANSSQSWSPGSACGLGFVPVVYYSLLLCLGLPEIEKKKKKIQSYLKPRIIASSTLLPSGSWELGS